MPEAGLRREVERTLSERTGGSVQIEGESSLGGGCISNALRLDTSAGPYFLKFNHGASRGMFLREAEGLAALGAVGALPVPDPIRAADAGPDYPAFLLTSYIQSGTKHREFWEDFGTRFARLHRNGRGERFGFERDNHIGATIQRNGWSDDWVDFFRERRLGFQLDLARANGYTGELQTLGNRLSERLGEFLAEPDEPPTLLHGDLWSGNFMVGPEGEAVLIDPACYYGRREADLAMTKLFGGFAPSFYAAYEEEWPLAPGSNRRMEIYTLYHLLNHLNLFGGSYLGQCLNILGRFDH